MSFTHLIGYAVVKAARGDAGDEPRVRRGRRQARPGEEPEHVNLGLAIDLRQGRRHPPAARRRASRTPTRWTSPSSGPPTRTSSARRAATSSTADDFAGTTISLTNPGTIGTVHSVPRLMSGQGSIVGVGAMEYPAEFQGASAETLAEPRGQQGHDADVDLRPPHHPGRAVRRLPAPDAPAAARRGRLLRRASSARCASRTSRSAGRRTSRSSHEDEIGKPARVVELIHAYRVRGHLMADTNPLEFEMRRHPDLDVVNHGLTLWDLDREFADRRVRRQDDDEAARDPRRAARLLLPHRRHRVHAHPGPRAAQVDPGPGRASPHRPRPRRAAAHPRHASTPAEAFETFLQTKYVGQKRFSLEGGESVIPLLDAILASAATQRPRRGRHRHAAPRPAQRARQHRRQDLRPDLPRVRGQHRPASRRTAPAT